MGTVSSVVIVGSGFTGFECARRLARQLRKHQPVEVTIISPIDYMLQEITPPTAQHATRQRKVLARNVAASLGYGTPKNYRHRNMGLVVDLGPHHAVANPLNVPLSGYPAKFVTRAYHLYAMPRLVNRRAVALAYLTDTVFPRSVVSMGLSTQEDAQFSASQGIPLPKA